MIGYWPDPLPGELLYGTLARLTQRTAPPDLKAAMCELFGNSHVQAIVDLPSNLDHLIAALPTGHVYSADVLINRHTTLPFYAPFLPAARAAAARAAMCQKGRGSTVHSTLGLMAGRMPAPRWLRFCPKCDAESMRAYGEISWQRLHQLAGIEICPVHQLLLEEDHRARRFSPHTRHAFVDRGSTANGLRDVGRTIRPLVPFDALRLRLARAAAWLLDGPRDFLPGPARLREGYVELLAERGLASHGGRLRLKILVEEFRASYGATALAHLHCELPVHGSGWLAELLRSRQKVQNPIRHLLLMDFLGHDPESFFTRLRSKEGIFGPSPWPCLNAVCPHHRHDVIVRVTISHHAERKRPVGEFCCPRCGFTYLRDGPDRTGERRGRADAVRDYGPRWKATLRRFWSDPKRSLRSLSRTLSVDPLTAKRWALILGLAFPRTVGARTSTEPRVRHQATLSADPSRLLSHDRTAWLTAVREAPTTSPKELRIRLPALYMRLYRHDRAWLRQHQPALSGPAKLAIPRVDWPARDTLLAAHVPFGSFSVADPTRTARSAQHLQFGTRDRCFGARAKTWSGAAANHGDHRHGV